MSTSTSDIKFEYPHYCPSLRVYLKRMLDDKGHQITPDNFWKKLLGLTIQLMLNINHLWLCFGKNEKLFDMFLDIFNINTVFKRYRINIEKNKEGMFRVSLNLSKKTLLKRGREVPKERVIQFLMYLLQDTCDMEIKFSPAILDYLVILAVHFENWWLMEFALNKGADFHFITFNMSLTTQMFWKTSHVTLNLSREYFNTPEEYYDISRKYPCLTYEMSNSIIRWCYTFKEKVFEELHQHLCISDLAKFVLSFL